MTDVNKLKNGEVVLVKFHNNRDRGSYVVGKFQQTRINPLFVNVLKIGESSNKLIPKNMICYSWEIYKLTVLCA